MFKDIWCILPKNHQYSKSKRTSDFLNDENPLLRKREVPLTNGKSSNQKKSIPYPSSYLPEFFYKNNVDDPSLIFKNLTNKAKKGKPTPNNFSSINDQIIEFYGCKNIKINVDINKQEVLDTWNKRFPRKNDMITDYSKVSENDTITDILNVSDLQYLHIFAFNKNASIFLLFKNGEKMYNMKLGPDNSLFDIHFRVSNDESFLNFERIDISMFKQTQTEFNSSSSQLLFLDLEDRDPISYVKPPDLDCDSFEKVSLNWKELNEPNQRPVISFKSKKELNNFVVQIFVTTFSPKEKRKLKKIKSVVFETFQSPTLMRNDNSFPIFTNFSPIICRTNTSSFYVTLSKEDETAETKSKEDKLNNNAPLYKYKFYPIKKGKIIYTSMAEITSKYQLSFCYMSGNEFFSIGIIDSNNFALGICHFLDTEVTFEHSIEGQFVDATYMEKYSCLVICYKTSEKYDFALYDNCKHEIKKCQIANLPKEIGITSIAALSHTYFASYYTKDAGSRHEIEKEENEEDVQNKLESNDKWPIKTVITKQKNEKNEEEESSSCYWSDDDEGKDKTFYCFHFDPEKRNIEYADKEQWRINFKEPKTKYLIEKECGIPNKEFTKKFLIEKSSNKSDTNFLRELCFIDEVDLENSTKSVYIYKNGFSNYSYTPSFISNQFSNQKEKIDLKFDFCLNEDFSSLTDENNDDELMNRRITQGNGMSLYCKGKENEEPIQSMLTLVPCATKDFYTTFDLQCSVCELFPSPIAINGRIVYILNNVFNFYRCDYRVYRSLSHQIFGFFRNTFDKMSLFSTEIMFNKYNFIQKQITVIVDTCGIGSHFANTLFGTRFEENDVREGDIWCGFSYSKSLASIILLFRVDDVENISKAILSREKINGFEHEKHLASIFLCTRESMKNSIYFGYNPSMIIHRNSLKKFSYFNENDFHSGILSFMKLFDFQQDDLLMSIIEDEKVNIADLAKEIVTQYLSYREFSDYPMQTIEKYSTQFLLEKSPINNEFQIWPNSDK